MSELFDYRKSIVELLKHIEDILVKYSLQNYASADAVFLAHYTAKLPLAIAGSLVMVLGLVYLLAIWTNARRYEVFVRIHRIVRNQWLEQPAQDQLRNALRADPTCKEYLASSFSPWTFLPVYLINGLPPLSALFAMVVNYLQPGLLSPLS